MSRLLFSHCWQKRYIASVVTQGSYIQLTFFILTLYITAKLFTASVIFEQMYQFRLNLISLYVTEIQLNVKIFGEKHIVKRVDCMIISQHIWILVVITIVHTSLCICLASRIHQIQKSIEAQTKSMRGSRNDRQRGSKIFLLDEMREDPNTTFSGPSWACQRNAIKRFTGVPMMANR